MVRAPVILLLKSFLKGDFTLISVKNTLYFYRKPLQKQPLVILCLCFISGILIQDYFAFARFFVFGFLILSFLGLFLYYVRNFYFRRFRYLFLFLFFSTLGLFAHLVHSKKAELPSLSDSELLEFKLSKKLNSNENNRRYEIISWKDYKEVHIVISVPRNQPSLDFSHYYKSKILLTEVRKPYHDFQFNYAKYLERQGIFYQGYIPGDIKKATRSDLSFAEKIKQKRLEVLGELDQTKWDKRTKEFTKGIILADRTEMDSVTVEDFSKSGLMHILAISGSHMAVFFWIVLFLLKPFCKRNVQYVVALIIIWFFAVFIDYGSSVVRSCIMLSAYYIFVILQRKPDLLHSMALAAFIILIVDTNEFFDVGFQLSFAAVLGIYWFNRPILKYFPTTHHPLIKTLQNVVSISIAAQLATLPLVLYYFHQYSWISLIANLVLIPFSQIIIVWSLMMVFLVAFGINISSLNTLYDETVNHVLQLIHVFAEIDLLFVKMIPFTVPELVLAAVVIYWIGKLIKAMNLKNCLRLSYFLLLLMVVRFSFSYKANSTDEVLVHYYYQKKIISIKQNSKVTFILPSDLKVEKVSKYIIEPYLTSRRTKDFIITYLPEGTESIKIGKKSTTINDQ